MARGFLSGAIWGTVLAVGGLSTISVMSDDPNEPDATPPELTETAVEPDVQVAQTEAPQPDSEGAVSDPEPEPEAAPVEAGAATPTPTEPVSRPGRRPTDVTGVEAETNAPDLDVPAAGSDAAPDTTSVAPIPAPETGDTVAGLISPTDQASPSVTVDGSGPAPEAPSPAPTLTAPNSEVGLSVSTEPAQPPAPAVPDVQTALVPDVVPDVMPEPVQDLEVQAETPASPERPTVRRLVPDVPTPDAVPEARSSTLARPAIGKPASSLVDRSGSTSSRLPSIADPTAAPETDTAAPDVPTELPPLQRFAAPVDVDPALPRMAIILIDDGSGPLGPDALDNFPFPVTFALNPGQAGAADRMAAYRALGFEVATLADLPEAAQPSDVEQLLAGAIAALPETTALIEAPGSGLQASRTSTEQMASFAAESGHGIVFLPNGLNTAEAIARRDNVPAVSILRDFDGEGQDARTKRRFLDGAAFRARQDGGVVMLGRLSPDTLSALLLWSLQDRATSVAMVPVSAILLDSSQ